MTDPRQAYASARVHARHARRPGAAQWGTFEASRTAAHYLDALRAGRWLHVPEGDLVTDVDARERWLRSSWRRACDEVADWHPSAWRPAFRWLAVLPDLDALERLRDGEPLPAWLQADPALAVLADLPPEARAGRLGDTAYAPLRDAWRRGDPLGAAWRLHWRTTWPSSDLRTRRGLEALVRSVEAARVLAATARRETIEAAAHLVFRRAAATPAEGAAQLALLALQLERVRGGLARRTLPSAPGDPG